LLNILSDFENQTAIRLPHISSFQFHRDDFTTFAATLLSIIYHSKIAAFEVDVIKLNPMFNLNDRTVGQFIRDTVSVAKFKSALFGF
jgi:hypothetical protein